MYMTSRKVIPEYFQLRIYLIHKYSKYIFVQIHSKNELCIQLKNSQIWYGYWKSVQKLRSWKKSLWNPISRTTTTKNRNIEKVNRPFQPYWFINCEKYEKEKIAVETNVNFMWSHNNASFLETKQHFTKIETCINTIFIIIVPPIPTLAHFRELNELAYTDDHTILKISWKFSIWMRKPS